MLLLLLTFSEDSLQLSILILECTDRLIDHVFIHADILYMRPERLLDCRTATRFLHSSAILMSLYSSIGVSHTGVFVSIGLRSESKPTSRRSTNELVLILCVGLPDTLGRVMVIKAT